MLYDGQNARQWEMDGEGKLDFFAVKIYSFTYLIDYNELLCSYGMLNLIMAVTVRFKTFKY